MKGSITKEEAGGLTAIGCLLILSVMVSLFAYKLGYSDGKSQSCGLQFEREN